MSNTKLVKRNYHRWLIWSKDHQLVVIEGICSHLSQRSDFGVLYQVTGLPKRVDQLIFVEGVRYCFDGSLAISNQKAAADLDEAHSCIWYYFVTDRPQLVV